MSAEQGREGAFEARHVLDALEAAGCTAKPADFAARMDAVTANEARAAIAGHGFSPARLTALLSPAAAALLEPMAQAAYAITRQRFGNAITLFAPLYLSNYCVNQCRYCGFNAGHPHRRRRLSLDDAAAEADIIAAEGFGDILLVSSEDTAYINTEYLTALARRLRAGGRFSSISVEIDTQPEAEYRALHQAGIDGVTIFQETYDRTAYAYWHPGGPKSVMDHRILASEAAARAGMRRVGLGVLLGLEDWRFDTLAMAVHADALMHWYWKSKVSFSFPRIRPSESGRSKFPYVVQDADLAQMIVALRLCFPDAGMTLSTRELPHVRDKMIPLGITQISAGSKTNPGGYGESRQHSEASSTEQFEVSDDRSPAQIAAMLRAQGFDPVWKDWDTGFAP